MDFQLKGVPLLSRIGADRADQVRTDVDAAAAGWPDAALLRLDSRNQVMVAGGKVLLGEAKDLADKPPPDAVFLGRIDAPPRVGSTRSAAITRQTPTSKLRSPTCAGAASFSTTSALSWCRPLRRC